MNLPPKAALAPLFIRRSFNFKAGFRGSMRKIPFGRILTFTPLREREQQPGKAVLANTLASISATRHLSERWVLLPLPGGEGRGEEKARNEPVCFCT